MSNKLKRHFYSTRHNIENGRVEMHGYGEHAKSGEIVRADLLGDGKYVFSGGLIKAHFCRSNRHQKCTENGVVMVRHTKTTNYMFSAHEHGYYCSFLQESLPWPYYH